MKKLSEQAKTYTTGKALRLKREEILRNAVIAKYEGLGYVNIGINFETYNNGQYVMCADLVDGKGNRNVFIMSCHINTLFVNFYVNSAQ